MASCRILTVDGECCVFPFIYNGWIYNSCTKEDYSHLWCATTSDFNKDKSWGECAFQDIHTTASPRTTTLALLTTMRIFATTSTLKPGTLLKSSSAGMIVGIVLGILISVIISCVVIYFRQRDRTCQCKIPCYVRKDNREDDCFMEDDKRNQNSKVRKSSNRFLPCRGTSPSSTKDKSSLDSTLLYCEPTDRVERDAINEYYSPSYLTTMNEKKLKPPVPSKPPPLQSVQSEKTGNDIKTKRKPMPAPRPKLFEAKNEYYAAADIINKNSMENPPIEEEKDYCTPLEISDIDPRKPMLQAENQYYASADVLGDASSKNDYTPLSTYSPNNTLDNRTLHVTASSSSAQMFRRSQENLTGDGEMNDTNFAEYVAVNGSDAVYKKPSNVLKFDPPSSKPLHPDTHTYVSMNNDYEEVSSLPMNDTFNMSQSLNDVNEFSI